MLGTTLTLTLPPLFTTVPLVLDLASYFNFATSYTLMSNPQNSATIINSTLCVTGALRNMTYSLVVAGVNGYGTSAISSKVLSISHGPLRQAHWHREPHFIHHEVLNGIANDPIRNQRNAV